MQWPNRRRLDGFTTKGQAARAIKGHINYNALTFVFFILWLVLYMVMFKPTSCRMVVAH